MRAETKKHRSSLVVAVAVVLSAVCSPQAHAAVFRVATTGVDGPSCGTAASPCRTLQHALDLATSGDEIRLAEGVYTGVSTSGGHTQLAWIRDKMVTVRGGFTTSNWSVPNPDAHPTILDAEGQGMVLYISYAAMGDGSTHLEGLQITGGNATDAIAGEHDGGGIHIDITGHMHVRIEDCGIHDNIAESGAGGILSNQSIGLWVEDSSIENNTGHGIKTVLVDVLSVTDSMIADNSRAGIIVGVGAPNVTITGNQFLRNSPGAKLSSLFGTVSGNTFQDNSGEGTGGGGLDVAGAVDATITWNTFIGNEGTSGGALQLTGPASTTVANNVAVSNSAPFFGYSGGGAFYIDAGATGADVEVVDNWVEGNSAYNQGGGMYLLGNVWASGNVIANNSSQGGGGIVCTITGTLQENLFVGNSAGTGGGLYLVNPMGANLVRNEFRGNQATNGNGGGASIWGGFFFDVSLDGNIAVGNSATNKGGGLYLESQDTDVETYISNTLVAENQADTGSGLYYFGGTMILSHSTIANHSLDPGDGVGLYLKEFGSAEDFEIRNSIIAGNEVGVHLASGGANLHHTLWGAGAWANVTDHSGGVVTDNDSWQSPGFLGEHNYHLALSSAARDAGVDVGVALDMDGEDRPDGASGIPDLGADEIVDVGLLFKDGFESGDASQW